MKKTIHTLVPRYLDPTKPFEAQSYEAIQNFKSAARQTMPELKEYEDIWPATVYTGKYMYNRLRGAKGPRDARKTEPDPPRQTQAENLKRGRRDDEEFEDEEDGEDQDDEEEDQVFNRPVRKRLHRSEEPSEGGDEDGDEDEDEDEEANSDTPPARRLRPRLGPDSSLAKKSSPPRKAAAPKRQKTTPIHATIKGKSKAPAVYQAPLSDLPAASTPPSIMGLVRKPEPVRLKRLRNPKLLDSAFRYALRGGPLYDETRYSQMKMTLRVLAQKYFNTAEPFETQKHSAITTFKSDARRMVPDLELYEDVWPVCVYASRYMKKRMWKVRYRLRDTRKDFVPARSGLKRGRREWEESGDDSDEEEEVEGWDSSAPILQRTRRTRSSDLSETADDDDEDDNYDEDEEDEEGHEDNDEAAGDPPPAHRLRPRIGPGLPVAKKHSQPRKAVAPKRQKITHKHTASKGKGKAPVVLQAPLSRLPSSAGPSGSRTSGKGPRTSNLEREKRRASQTKASQMLHRLKFTHLHEVFTAAEVESNDKFATLVAQNVVIQERFLRGGLHLDEFEIVCVLRELKTMKGRM